ncbi:hypothetical protein, partial [Ferrigenium sp. UT5]|uniref:hypothetical protein n=1 Tax=Ferrigenium sp. UT5 TaxID=3242105 RepID=UPI0038B2A26A
PFCTMIALSVRSSKMHSGEPDVGTSQPASNTKILTLPAFPSPMEFFTNIVRDFMDMHGSNKICRMVIIYREI